MRKTRPRNSARVSQQLAAKSSKGRSRYKPAEVKQIWPVITKNNGVQTTSLLFEMTNGLTANGIWLRAIGSSDAAPVTIVLNDKSKDTSASMVSDIVNRGEQVLAFDPTFSRLELER